MTDWLEDESYIGDLEREVALKLGVMPSSVGIVWNPAVGEHCVYVEGKYYDYLNNEGSVEDHGRYRTSG